MEYRNLGKSGLKVSAISFGSWVTFDNQINVDDAVNIMKTAFNNGVNFFDNAEAYAQGKSEIIMGKALKKLQWNRSHYILSTKIFWGGSKPNEIGLSRKHIIEGTMASLERFQQDYIDLIFCHRPDPETPIEETVRAMSYLINKGYALYWGTSEWSSYEIQTAYDIALKEHLIPPSMEQPEYNMLFRERFEVEYAPLYKNIGLGTTIWSPLSSGILTGKYGKGISEGRLTLPNYKWLKERWQSDDGKQKIKIIEKLRPIAHDLNASLAQLAIAWVLKNPNVSTCITGASKIHQLTENLKAIELVPKLSNNIMDEIEKILDNKPIPPKNWRE